MIFLFGCTFVPEITEEEKLAKASTKVIFASTEALGSHRYESRVRRKELREGIAESSHDEIVKIDWNDWDNFSYSRTIDDKEVTSIIVSNHIPWLKSYNKPWKEDEDAEPYRLQLRSAWNTWEQYIGSYEDVLSWKSLGSEEIEGRRVTRYELSVDPTVIPPARHLQLTSLSGSVSIDQATAVRLYTEMKLIMQGNGFQKEIDIQIKRLDIGRLQSITPPEANQP